MAERTQKLRKSRLNQMFVDGLGSAVQKTGDTNDSPLLLDLCHPFPLRLRVYLFNCTNPPGGRALDEFKAQIILPEHKKGERRASLDYSDGRMPILAAYASIDGNVQNGVFVLWDAHMHREFSYSANIQVKGETIISAMCEAVAEGTRNNTEVVLAARPQHLLAAIKRRVAIWQDQIQWEVANGT